MSDLIDRQAAIDTITAYPHGDVWNVENMENMVYEIKNLPSAQPKLLQPWEVLVAQAVLPQSAEPKRGRWISADAIFGGVPFYCSECGENTRDTVMGKPRWNFCPNCGADMRGEQND